MKGRKLKAETVKKANGRLSIKRKAIDKVSTKQAKKEKLGKDPNKPKRPPSAFFIFMENFRKQFKEKNPGNESVVVVVSKAVGEKWKSMSSSDKAPYESKAAKRKAEYNKVMASYNEEESDKSYSEVNDEDDEEERGEEEDDD